MVDSLSMHSLTLSVAGTASTPRVDFDGQTGRLHIHGVSMPESVLVFYRPILQWVRSYVEHPADRTLVRLDLPYFNTASSKLLLELLSILEDLYLGGAQVEVEWVYREDDLDMEEAGEDFSLLLELPFRMVEKRDE